MEAEKYFRTFFNFYRHHLIDSTDKKNPFKLNPFRHKLFVMMSVFILLACLLLAVYGKSFEYIIIPDNGCINQMIDWLCLSSTLATAFIVAWENLATSKEDVRIWNAFHAIESTLNLSPINSRNVLYKSQRLYKVIFYTPIVLLCVMGIILLLEYRKTSKHTSMVEFIIVFELLCSVDMQRMLHILLYIRILTCYLTKIQEDLRIALLSINQNETGSINKNKIQHQLQKCCKCYFLCMKAFHQVQDQFSWGLFMVCFKFSVIMWIEIYWTVYRAIMDTSFELFCLNVVPYHFVFISFTWSCESLYAEIKSLSQLLYTIDMNKASRSNKIRITHLMLLLDYKVFFFYTCGICRVSYKLIVQYAISGATKVSFIAQIMKDFYAEM